MHRNNEIMTERLHKNTYMPIKTNSNAQQSNEGIFDFIKFIIDKKCVYHEKSICLRHFSDI